MSVPKPIDRAYVNEYFQYEDGALFYKKCMNTFHVGTRAAWKHKLYGYMLVRIGGKNYPEHRIIWTMLRGEIPSGMAIDHINHDRADNHIENLRCVSARENSRNIGKLPQNKAGVTGIRWRKKYNSYEVTIGHHGSCYVGSYKTFEDAVAARKKAEIKHGYHPNHGKEKATTEAVAKLAA